MTTKVSLRSNNILINFKQLFDTLNKKCDSEERRKVNDPKKVNKATIKMILLDSKVAIPTPDAVKKKHKKKDVRQRDELLTVLFKIYSVRRNWQSKRNQRNIQSSPNNRLC